MAEYFGYDRRKLDKESGKEGRESGLVNLVLGWREAAVAAANSCWGVPAAVSLCFDWLRTGGPTGQQPRKQASDASLRQGGCIVLLFGPSFPKIMGNFHEFLVWLSGLIIGIARIFMLE